MSLYKSILAIDSEKALEKFSDENKIAEEIVNDLSHIFSNKTEKVIAGLKYIAYAYDKDSELIRSTTSFNDLKGNALRKCGLDLTNPEILLIHTNRHPEFGKVVGLYMRHTMTIQEQAKRNLEELLDEMFEMIRQRTEFNVERMSYDVYVRAIANKGDVGLKTIEVMKEIQALDSAIKFGDKYFDEKQDEQKEITPELKRKMRKQEIENV